MILAIAYLDPGDTSEVMQASQALLDEYRAEAAAVHVALRPRSELLSDPLQVQQQASLEDASTGSASSAAATYSDSKTWYLRTTRCLKGVLQIHEARNLGILLVKSILNFACQVPDAEAYTHGYRHLMRVEEIWPLLARAQPYANWYCKLSLFGNEQILMFPRSSVSLHSFCCWQERYCASRAMQSLEGGLQAPPASGTALQRLPHRQGRMSRAYSLERRDISWIHCR